MSKPSIIIEMTKKNLLTVPRASGFVLTGGRSSRMGRDKALLELGGKPMALWVGKLLRPFVDHLFLVGSVERHGHLGIPVLADRIFGRGPLGGIVTALSATQSPWNLIFACDLPFMEREYVEHLLARTRTSPQCDAVIASSQHGWQPLCAAYHRRCLAVFEVVLASGEGKIAEAFPNLQIEVLAQEELAEFAFPARMFKNVNTPEDFEEAQRWLATREPGRGAEDGRF